MLTSSQNYDSVFTNGNKKKKHKTKESYSDSIEYFIGKNNLETIFQKAYLTNILASNEFKGLECFMTETRGVGLIDFPITHGIKLKDREESYRTFIQLQGKIIKFALSVEQNYHSSKKEWVEANL